MKTKVAILGIVAALAAGGVATAWLDGTGPFAKSDKGNTTGVASDGNHAVASADSRFVTLDKLIVMLHTPNAARAHYLALDLVFQTDAKKEKQVKEQLPLLRSTAYHALSGFSVEDIRGMDVDQLSSVLQKAYVEVYGGTGAVPFYSVQVDKQMLE
ncbi:flagellar basal body-associated FliL family protein [Dyella jejuensis]|uniref:Flagellar protein FliL n=1 Tax=Dyella jejuensis TaxID=1432009 RepID=A0ABW8JL60_9GAMM